MLDEFAQIRLLSYLVWAAASMLVSRENFSDAWRKFERVLGGNWRAMRLEILMCYEGASFLEGVLWGDLYLLIGSFYSRDTERFAV